MKKIIKLLEKNEDWLIKKIISYSKKQNFTKYTSTLKEAWRLSIQGLTQSIIQSITDDLKIPELGPDEKYENDPLTDFGIIESQRHRKRGVTLEMFLGLMKYYRQSYIDLLIEKIKDKNNLENYRLFINRCFDRIELAFCTEWSKLKEKELIEELQETNRFMTNEKNMYLTAFESLTDPVIMLNDNFEIINLNHAAALIINPDHIPGKDYYNLESNKENLSIIKKKQNPVINQPLVKIFPSLKSIIKNIKVEKRKGLLSECKIETSNETKYYEIMYSHMLDISEKFTSIILSFRDISRRKIIENNIKENEKRYKSIIENMSDYIYSAKLENDGKIITEWITGAYQRITGYKFEEIKDTGFASILHPEDLRRFYSKQPDLLKNKSVLIEYRIITKNRKIKWLKDYIRPIWDKKEKRVTKLLGGVQDITETKEAENALRESVEKFKKLSETSPTAVLLYQYDKYIYANDAAVNITGYTKDELLKMNFWDNITEEYQEHLKKNGIARQRGDLTQNQRYEIKYKTKNNTIKWLDVSVGSTEHLGRPAGIVTAIDITGRKNLEEQLFKLATVDSLTGSNNRHRFFEKFREILQRFKRYGGSLAFLMMDIDHFKKINDTYGHHTGDEVLKKLVKKSLSILREPDIFGRIGGEEFAAVLLEIDAENSLSVAERLRNNIEKIRIKAENTQFNFTISIGLTTITKSDNKIDKIVNRADKALYKAKRTGRNKVIKL